MKALKKKTKILLIVAAVAILLLLAAVMLFAPSLIAPALWALLILGIGFLGLELWARRRKKSKQRAFDERVAAKEGIEDRKREWAGWIEELDRQGIDRYELPFYLIVGEPQSGKSVLLQNSDLYFPFGQERLSGVGGTRGCDWWFTDEAVILDIAGRLFTHEGGVADKLEWEAFLDQLSGFRPLCPANGVLLVIPCDALLEDKPETCADKANKIQSALLVLTQKLQAQLPVYLVLTKGDRVFGFAESVHRLDPEERHQMFGWSREADKAEKPFALDEAKAGFQTLVARARALRERMIASARLPEALPEIDRLYAFPDELAGMYPSLEIYLKRVFGESSLVDRTAFRGIYLTSGLQTGAPIARVCAELLGDDRAADARALESLFSHQRAYFIKDLVKRRVFAERGLVRPTEGRVLAARRNAMVGYGLAALLAVGAVIGAAVHLLKDRSTKEEQVFAAALQAGQHAAGSSDVEALLRDLDAIDRAVQYPRELMHEVFRSSREGFEALYTKVCDRALAPALRAAIEARLASRLKTDPASYAEFAAALADVRMLFEPLDFTDGPVLALLERTLPVSVPVRDANGEARAFSVRDALSRRRGSGHPVAPIGEPKRLGELARRMVELLDGALDPSKRWMIDGSLGYMVAWMDADGARKAIDRSLDPPDPSLLKLADQFAFAVAVLERTGNVAKAENEGKASNIEFGKQVRGLMDARLQFEKAIGRVAADAQVASWPRLAALASFTKPIWQANKGEGGESVNIFAGQLGRDITDFQKDLVGDFTAAVDVLTGDTRVWVDDTNGLLLSCRAEPRSTWTLRSVAGVVGQNHRKRDSLYDAKVAVLAAQLPDRFPNWAAASAEFHAGDTAPSAGAPDLPLLAAIASLRRDLSNAGFGTGPGVQRLAELMTDHLRSVQTAWSTRADWGTAIDWTIPTALIRIARDPIGGTPAGLADQLCWQYLGQHETRLLREWGGMSPEARSTVAIAAALNAHMAKLAELERAIDPAVPIPLDNPEHGAWLGRVDGELAGRLQAHVDALIAYWRPRTDGWLDLATAIDGIEGALSVPTLRKKIADFRKEVDAPPAEDPELRADRPIATAVGLPQTDKVLAALRAFTVPTENELRKHEVATALGTLIGRIKPDLAQGDGKALAAQALALSPLPPLPADTAPKTVDVYLRPLHVVLSERLLTDVRTRYVQELARVMLRPDAAVMNALYADTPAAIAAIEDLEVVRRLGQLLDPDGQFDQLRRDFAMLANPADPKARNLRPADDYAPAHDRGFWDLERFLIGLQQFLTTGGKTKVADAAFRVRLELPSRAGGAWDIDKNGNKSVFYYALHSSKSAFGFASFNQQWSPLEKPLEWEFSTERRPQFWFVWTSRPRSTFAYPADKLAQDAAYDLSGCLAPLLFAWSGTVVDGRFEVQFEPSDSAEKARLRLSFQAMDGASLALPKRPLRPSPF